MYEGEVFGDFDDVSLSDTLPKGEYKLRAVSVEIESHEKSGGKLVFNQFEVLEGEQAGRRLFNRQWLIHPNAKAVKHGHRECKKWLDACGIDVTGIFSSEKLFAAEGVDFLASIIIKEGKDGFEDENIIRKYKAVPEAFASKTPQTANQAVTQPKTDVPAKTTETTPQRKPWE